MKSHTGEVFGTKTVGKFVKKSHNGFQIYEVFCSACGKTAERRYQKSDLKCRCVCRTRKSVDYGDISCGYLTGIKEGNVQWVHKYVNNMKMSLDQGAFIRMCKKISENNKVTY